MVKAKSESSRKQSDKYYESLRPKIMSSFQGSLFFSFLFNAIFIYLAMVGAHLLGRFYYLNSETLNWEV